MSMLDTAHTWCSLIHSSEKLSLIGTPEKRAKENWSNRNNSAMHCLILLKFGTLVQYVEW